MYFSIDRLAGADLSQPDPSGRTALHVACLHGHLELVKYLLGHQVELNDLDLLGLSPLDYATRGGHNEIEEVLLASGGVSAATNANGNQYQELSVEENESDCEGDM